MIERLSSSDIAERDEATRSLIELGERAVAKLQVARQNTDPEVVSRATGVLMEITRRREGIILFVGGRVGQETICTMCWDGTDVRELVRGESPAVSPDGKSVAIIRRTEEGSQILTGHVDRPEFIVQWSGARLVSSVAWNPAGSAFAFFSKGLHVYSVESRSLRSFEVEIAGHFPLWSSGQERVYFIGELGLEPSHSDHVFSQRFGLFAFDLRTCRYSRIGSFRVALAQPMLSPDGRTMAILVPATNRTRELALLDVGTGRLDVVTKDALVSGVPAWSRDGDEIAFATVSSDSDGITKNHSECKILRLPERQSRPVCRLDGYVDAVVWSHDRAVLLLAVKGLKGPDRIVKLTADTGIVEPLGPREIPCYQPRHVRIK